MKVPVYDSPQVEPAPLPGARVQGDTSNGLGALGRGVEQLGAGVSAEIQHAKEKADVAATTAAISQWQNSALDLEHGSADGTVKGLFQTQGHDTMAASAPTIEALQKKQQEIAAGLANEDQKRLFLGHTGTLLLSHRQAIEEYTQRQVQGVQAASAASLEDAAVRTAQSNYTNVGKGVDLAEESARAAIAAHLQGMPGETVEQSLSQMRQRVTAARLESALGQGDVGAAHAILTDPLQVKRLGTAAEQYQRRFQGIQQASEVDARAQDIFNGAHVKGYDWHDAQAARAKVAALPPGPVLDGVSQKDRIAAHVERLISQDGESRKAFGQKLLDKARALYDESHSLEDPRLADIKRQALDPNNGASTEWEQFTRGVRADERASKSSTTEQRRFQAEADRQALFNFHALPPEEQTKVDADRDPLFADASSVGRAAIKAAQRTTLNAVAKSGLEPEAEFRDHLKSVAEQAGFAGDKAKVVQFYGAMGAWRAQQMLQNNKPPTRDEVAKQVQAELTKGNSGGFFSHFTRDKYRFQFGEGDTFVSAGGSAPTVPAASAATPAPAQSAAQSPAPSEAIPADAVTRLRASFARKGNASPSDEQLRDAYVRAKAKGLL